MHDLVLDLVKILLTSSKRSLHDLAQVLKRRSCGDLGDVLSKRFLHDLVQRSLHEDLAVAMYLRCFYESSSGMHL